MLTIKVHVSYMGYSVKFVIIVIIRNFKRGIKIILVPKIGG